jgi:predicted acyltransferase
MSSAQVEPLPREAPPSPQTPERLFSLDAFRGITMVWMISVGFGFRFFHDSPLMGRIADQFEHTDWHGMSAWDLIQPFFMFIVGVAMPLSYRRRWAAGETWGHTFLHVIRRCVLLILLGIMARSIEAGQPVLDVINVLSQLGFTYFFAFLVLRRSWIFQGVTALGFLVAGWAIYQFGSAPGVLGPWVKDANIGWYLDRLILHKNWHGSYATINCVAETANNIFGVMVGWLLLSGASAARKMKILALAGAACLALGLAMDPVVPIIKKIWTPSFAIYSAGYTLLTMLALYWLCDIKKWRKWAQVFAIVGANSIFIYLFHEILSGWMNRTALVFTAWAVHLWGPWGKMLNVNLAIAFQIYVCYWLYRRKIFFKL